MIILLHREYHKGAKFLVFTSFKRNTPFPLLGCPSTEDHSTSFDIFQGCVMFSSPLTVQPLPLFAHRSQLHGSTPEIKRRTIWLQLGISCLEILLVFQPKYLTHPGTWFPFQLEISYKNVGRRRKDLKKKIEYHTFNKGEPKCCLKGRHVWNLQSLGFQSLFIDIFRDFEPLFSPCMEF